MGLGLYVFNIKEYFGLKTEDVKPLIALHREVSRVFVESRPVKDQPEDTGGVPAWYEVTERGSWRFLPGILADYLVEKEDVIYVADWFHFYQDGVYLKVSDKAAYRKVRSFMNSRYAQKSHIEDAEWQWEIMIDKTVREININPYVLNFKNGLYNVLEDTFEDHNPKYYSTIQLGGKHDPSAECPIFMAFLNDVLADPEIYLLQEIFGYLMLPVNKAQKSFVLVGAANAGKSTLLWVVQDVLLGREHVSNIPWQMLSEQFQTAELFGKLANLFADLPSKSIEDSGTFKAVTGEDYITADRKYKDPFSFKPFARMLFSCEEIPRNFGDRSDGFYRRLIIIRFHKSVPPEKRDPHLKEKFAGEADGIIAWALVGLKRLIANNYTFSETDKTRAELSQYRIENNSALAFINDCCVVELSAECLREDLFTAYRDYCEHAGLKPLSNIKFNREVEHSNTGITRGLEGVSRRRIWNGIRLQ